MDPMRAQRRIRQAGYAALVFAVFQLLVLPAPLHHASGGEAWVVEWMTIATVGAALLLAIMAIRESTVAGTLLGFYGLYLLLLLGYDIVRVLDGTMAQIPLGPAYVLGVVTLIPFAVFWVRGGRAALAVTRTRRKAPMSAA
jgi:hypothetical protein